MGAIEFLLGLVVFNLYIISVVGERATHMCDPIVSNKSGPIAVYKSVGVFNIGAERAVVSFPKTDCVSESMD